MIINNEYLLKWELKTRNSSRTLNQHIFLVQMFHKQPILLLLILIRSICIVKNLKNLEIRT